MQITQVQLGIVYDYCENVEMKLCENNSVSGKNNSISLSYDFGYFYERNRTNEFNCCHTSFVSNIV